ncbi:MAG: hypothetical protein V3W41_07110 [Planctomycetota bacterium]
MMRTIAVAVVAMIVGGAVVAFYFKNAEKETSKNNDSARVEASQPQGKVPRATKSGRSAAQMPPRSDVMEAYGNPGGDRSTSRPTLANATKPTSRPKNAATNKSGAFSAPKGWIGETPSNNMRVAQFLLPKVGKDTEDGQVVIFHFPSAGGTTASNINRWVGQLEGRDDAKSSPIVTRERQKSSGFDLETVDVKGRFVAQVVPGDPERHNKPEWRLIGGVVEAAGGSYFIKATGPEATMAKWESSLPEFFAMVTDLLRRAGVKPL